MAKSSDVIYLPDGSFDFSGGVDSSLVTTLKSALNPGGLARNQLAWMFNCTVRGGGILQRTGFQPLLKLLPGGRWQGDFMYEPDSANPYLVFFGTATIQAGITKNDRHTVPLYTHPMRELTDEEIAGAVARGWCSEKNSMKTMDSDLAWSIV